MAQHNGSGTAGRADRARRRTAAAAAVVLLAAAAVLAGAATAVAKPASPVLAFTPSPYDYGRVSTGESAAQRFRLTNTGGKATGKLTVRLSGAAAFTIGRDTCSGTKLRPGRSCVVRVRFAPTSTATVIADLTAASKKPAASATVALSGTGAALGAAPGQLYWAAGSQGSLWAANLDGTGAQPIVIRQANPQGVAVGASNIYWADAGSGGGSAANGSIWEADLDGSNATPIAIRQLEPWGIAVGASHIYWTDTSTGTINQANLDGTNAQAIVTGQTLPFGIAVSANHLYWSTRPNNQPFDGTIWRANLNATNATPIVPGRQLPAGVAVSTSHLYWVDTGDGTVNQANLDGTSPQVIATPGPSQIPLGVAVGAGHLYWTTNTDGSIWEANLDGTSAQAIVTGQTDPEGVAVTPGTS